MFPSIHITTGRVLKETTIVLKNDDFDHRKIAKWESVVIRIINA